ncbi:MAG: hypothetical protein KA886_04110 [Candidatus Cloacimonetes bacterium]|nr:hypothetical protein [Candidatus Cloacimonadota bacterium]HPM02173.1 DUF6485 family protein [Candidatus Cloacimonadota bacterium]
MDCQNNQLCNCTYPCSKNAKCCECIAYHRKNKELPACYFPKEAEKTYNRSIDYYIKLIKEGKV